MQHSYEITQRPIELDDGWQQRLLEDEQEAPEAKTQDFC